MFKFMVNNNQAEYEAFIVGLTLAKDLVVLDLECRTNSQRVVGQMNGDFHIKDNHLLQYFHKAT